MDGCAEESPKIELRLLPYENVPLDSIISAPALLGGLEWNVRLAALETPAMLRKFEGTFEAYCDAGEFEPYAATPEQRDRLDHQLSLARGVDLTAASGSGASTAPVWFDLRPYAYQREMLDALAAERLHHQRWHKIVVAVAQQDEHLYQHRPIAHRRKASVSRQAMCQLQLAQDERRQLVQHQGWFGAADAIGHQPRQITPDGCLIDVAHADQLPQLRGQR